MYEESHKYYLNICVLRRVAHIIVDNQRHVFLYSLFQEYCSLVMFIACKP